MTDIVIEQSLQPKTVLLIHLHNGFLIRPSVFTLGRCRVVLSFYSLP